MIDPHFISCRRFAVLDFAAPLFNHRLDDGTGHLKLRPWNQTVGPDPAPGISTLQLIEPFPFVRPLRRSPGDTGSSVTLGIDVAFSFPR